MKLIDKSAVVAEIEKRKNICEKVTLDLRTHDNKAYYHGKAQAYGEVLDYLDTLEVKEVDFDTLGILADHLIACDAHCVSPEYNEKELGLLERMRNNKAQKGE